MGKMKTLNRVAALRRQLGFSPGEMADLLGVNLTTLYRWESGAADRMDPLQHKILAYAQYQFDNRSSDKWTPGLKQAITLGGTLKGLSYLLKPLSEHA